MRITWSGFYKIPPPMVTKGRMVWLAVLSRVVKEVQEPSTLLGAGAPVLEDQ